MRGTGWSRDNARRAIRTASTRHGSAAVVVRRPRGRGYSYDELKVLIEVWSRVGQPCGKYLVPILAQSSTQLEAHGELRAVAARLTPAVREEVLAMSAATIDRYVALTKKALDPAAKAATRPGSTLRASIPVRAATAATETVPGFFEVDLVAHCEHTLAGDAALQFVNYR